METAEFQFLSTFLQKSSGLALASGKEYLLEARLLPLVRQFGLPNFSELIAELRRGSNPQVASAVSEAMTTNETSFFRDKSPFEDLKNVILPRLIAARSAKKTLRIWCAAASSGQEPYSLLILIADNFPILHNWRIDFVATDLSEAMITRSRSGIYSQFEVQRGLPVQQLVKHFQQCPSGWQVSEALRSRVKFEQLNLLDSFSRLGPCDLVLCRNVLIYFDTPVKSQILNRVHGVMQNDGYLMLGAAETVLGVSTRFQRVRECTSAVYLPEVMGRG